MVIKTSDNKSIKPFLNKLYIPPSHSHKGQNGKLLVIGGSGLFHAASIWASEVASHFVDIVHYSSTVENEEIFLSLKKKFINGIVVKQSCLPEYVKEDDAILIGPGMIRSNEKNSKFQISNSKFEEILQKENEGEFTYFLTKFLIENFPDKKFVLDAGALQMMECDWLKILKTKAIITPHQIEFANLFGINIQDKTVEDKIKIVEEKAKEYNVIILLKAVVDIISDGEKTVVVEGGNQGLTKGGTGDVLAGLASAFFTKNDSFTSAVVASYLLKTTADELFKIKGYWYNIDDIICKIPEVLKALI